MTEQELNIIFNKHHKSLLYFSISILGDSFYAEDMVANTFVKFWNAYKDTDIYDSENVKGLLFGYAKHECLNQLKKNIRIGAHYKNVVRTIDIYEDEIESKIIKSEYLQLIYEGAQRLPAGRKKIFDLIFVHDKSYEEIVKITGLSIDFLRAEKWRILKEIKDQKGFKKYRNAEDVYEFNGKSKSISEWAKDLGITSTALRARIKAKGFEAAMLNTRKTKNVIEYNGKRRPLKEWASILGINYNTLHRRLFDYNMAIEQAFSKR